MILNIQNYIHLDYGVPRQCMRQVTSDVHLAKKKAPLAKRASVDDIYSNLQHRCTRWRGIEKCEVHFCVHYQLVLFYVGETFFISQKYEYHRFNRAYI